MDTVTSLSVSALLSLLGTRAAPRVVDVRRTPAFEADPLMIAGAVRRAHDAVGEWAGALARGRPVVAYCVHGREVSRGVAEALRSRGIDALYLEGGAEAWHAQAAPTVRKLAEVGHGATAPTRWVTRKRPKIDRLACPWLVRRFIDPLAEIVYAPAHEVVERARAIGGVSFDLPGVRFSHRAERCSFDAILEDFDLRVPGLDTLATIVRGADTGRLDLAPQAPGLLAISLGLGRSIADDIALLEAAMPVYDALYLWCRDAQAETHGRSVLP
jgi:rhodanese-related sulfurtransferase